MSIDKIRERLLTIHQANGYLFNVPEVVEGDKSTRTRGVAVKSIGKGFAISINAQGITLAKTKTYITDLLGTDFKFHFTDDPVEEAVSFELEDTGDAVT